MTLCTELGNGWRSSANAPQNSTNFQSLPPSNFCKLDRINLKELGSLANGFIFCCDKIWAQDEDSKCQSHYPPFWLQSEAKTIGGCSWWAISIPKSIKFGFKALIVIIVDVQIHPRFRKQWELVPAKVKHETNRKKLEPGRSAITYLGAGTLREAWD